MNQTPALRIRRASSRDAALLAEFGARTFQETFGPHNRPEDMATYLAGAFGERIQAAELADPAFTGLIAGLGVATAGYALLHAGDPPPCVPRGSSVELARFYVDRPWHGRGVAPVLMAACRKAARERDARHIWLCVWERNPRAIAYYRKERFVDVGSTAFVLGADVQTDRVMVWEDGGAG